MEGMVAYAAKINSAYPRNSEYVYHTSFIELNFEFSFTFPMASVMSHDNIPSVKSLEGQYRNNAQQPK